MNEKQCKVICRKHDKRCWKESVSKASFKRENMHWPHPSFKSPHSHMDTLQDGTVVDHHFLKGYTPSYWIVRGSGWRKIANYKAERMLKEGV